MFYSSYMTVISKHQTRHVILTKKKKSHLLYMFWKVPEVKSCYYIHQSSYKSLFSWSSVDKRKKTSIWHSISCSYRKLINIFWPIRFEQCYSTQTTVYWYHQTFTFTVRLTILVIFIRYSNNYRFVCLMDCFFMCLITECCTYLILSTPSVESYPSRSTTEQIIWVLTFSQHSSDSNMVVCVVPLGVHQTW